MSAPHKSTSQQYEAKLRALWSSIEAATEDAEVYWLGMHLLLEIYRQTGFMPEKYKSHRYFKEHFSEQSPRTEPTS